MHGRYTLDCRTILDANPETRKVCAGSLLSSGLTSSCHASSLPPKPGSRSPPLHIPFESSSTENGLPTDLCVEGQKNYCRATSLASYLATMRRSRHPIKNSPTSTAKVNGYLSRNTNRCPDMHSLQGYVCPPATPSVLQWRALGVKYTWQRKDMRTALALHACQNHGSLWPIAKSSQEASHNHKVCRNLRAKEAWEGTKAALRYVSHKW